jgi:hypothetical protein
MTEPSNSPVSPGALEELTRGIERKAKTEDAFLAYGPTFAQLAEDASEPPEKLAEPVWNEKRGWMERQGFDGLVIHAPDELAEE